MAWFVSYRTGGSIVMHIFKKKELAIDAACGLLNRAVPRRSLTAAGPKRVSARQLAVVDLVL